jgi:hypothetical protein
LNLRWPTVVALCTVSLTAQAAKPQRHALIIGDSEACAVYPYARTMGDQVSVECTKSTRVEWWAEGRFQQALDKHPDADTVVVFLGTNDYYDTRAPDVKPILDAVSNRHLACVWAGNTPVHGRKHWPINEMLRAAVVPTCSYFDTEAAGIQLLPDEVHPTPEGAAKWIRKVWSALPPIR